MGIFSELRRRRVFRFTGLYIVAAWVLLQVVALAFESWQLPSTALRYIWLAVILAFPVAVIFAWRYDFTTDGIIRSSPSDQGELSLRLNWADYSILLAMFGIVAFIAYDTTNKVIETPAASRGEDVAVVIPQRSVAVLPFQNLSDDSSDEYFAEGLADTLLHKLAQLSRLKVIARNSSFQFQGEYKDIREIGKILNVSTVLEGSVQRDGDRIRVIAQLIDTSDGTHLFSKSFEDDFQEIFALQDRLADSITSELQVQMSAAERERFYKDGTDKPQAYELLMRAIKEGRNVQWGKLTLVDEEIYSPIQLVRRAIALDPNYPHAWAELAQYYDLLAFWSDTSEKFSHYVQLSRDAAEQALRLDPNLDRAHTALGFVEWRVQRANEAAKHFRAALELNPNSSGAASGLGLALLISDPGTSLEMFTLAHEIDPTSTIVYRHKHLALLALGRDEEAVQQLKLGIERYPDEGVFYSDLAYIYFRKLGRMDESARWMSRYVAREGFTMLASYYMSLNWLAVADEERLKGWLSQMRSERDESEWLAELEIYALLSSGASAEALARIAEITEMASNELTIARLRAAACLLAEELECTREVSSDWVELANQMFVQGVAKKNDVLEAQLYKSTVDRGRGSTGATNALEVMLLEVHDMPLTTSNFATGFRGYKEVVILSLLGRRAEALEALQATLSLPDGGIMPFDFLGFRPENSPLLAGLVGTSKYEVWLAEFEDRRETILEKMKALEAAGEIASPPAVQD